MVNRKRGYTFFFFTLGSLCCIALACVNYLSMAHRARLDLTGDKRFTLSDGTARLFEGLTEPVHVTYFVDEEPPPKRINLERDVRDKLQELSVSSEGRLTWQVERITTASAESKLEELEKRKVTRTLEVQTSGSGETARVRGFDGYFSSLEVKYGLAEPVVINGVRNLVDALDEAAAHRVDTLEFDISFAVLQMRARGTRAPVRLMVQSLEQPLDIIFLHSAQMPATNPQLANTVDKALTQFVADSKGKATYRRVASGWGRDDMRLMNYLMPAEETVDPADPSRKGNKFYYSAVQIAVGDVGVMIHDFSAETTTEAVIAKLEQPLTELLRPRSKVGFILPPGAVNQQQPGQPPTTDYQPAFEYMRNNFGYEIVQVNLPAEKRIPRDLAALVIFEPNKLAERELYEVDRFLAEGGNLVLLFQGWESNLSIARLPAPQTLRLSKVDVMPHFTQWAQNLGIEFGQELLLDKSGSMRPYIQTRQGGSERVPTSLTLAPVVEARDINSDSIYGRKLAGMPLPLPVELKLNDEKLAALQLQRQDVLTLRDDIYRFIPSDPAFPEISLRLDLNSPAEVEDNPSAEPGKEIRAQRLGHGALVATSLRGTFPSFWDSDSRTVPAWDGAAPGPESEEGKRAPELKARPGSLLVCTSAGTLNIHYLHGYEFQEAIDVVIPTGSTFFRNVAETHIFGDDLVNLRVRTGIAPRIAGNLSDGRRAWWLFLCIAGAPLALLAFGIGRGLLKARARQEYEAALSTEAKS